MDALKPLFNTYFSLIVRVGIILIILANFFLFTNLTTEFFDTAKFLTLLLITSLLLILLVVKFNLSGRVVVIRTPLDIPLLLLLAVGIISTVLSPAPFVALLGNQLRIHGSLVSLVIYIIFYFVLVNLLRSVREIRVVLLFTAMAASLLSLLTLMAYLGVKILPAPWTHGPNFTPTGSSFSTAAVLALLIPLTVSSLLSATKPIIQVLSAIFLTLSGLTIALTGNLAVWTAALLGLILTLASHRLSLRQLANHINPTRLITLLTPPAVVLLVIVLSAVPPLGGAQNLLYSQAKNFPKQSQLPLITSWKISVSAFRDSPFWGSGPGTYLFDFTNYKPIEFNSTKDWNIRFETAFNEYLQVLATLGGVGLVALLTLTALYISSAWPYLRAVSPSIQSDLATAGLMFFVMLALHPSTLPVWVFGLLILAAFMTINQPQEDTSTSWAVANNLKQTFFKIAKQVSSNTSEETIRINALPSVLLTICLGVVIFSYYFGAKFALADAHHRTALNALAANQGIVAYNELVTAEKLNPVSDLYRIDLAQTNFALANAIASAKGPTEAAPEGSLSDQDKQNIQVLLQQSITEGRQATTLSPKSAQNWEILGLLYRQIAGVAQNALVFSLDSYGRAIFQDPLNPQLRLSVGGVYYAIRNYDLAIRFFTDAINLKPDFANGYYNLAVAFKDKGDLATAQAAAEKVLTLVDKDSQDYKIANDFLTDLKKITAVQPPAAETTGALQQQELPKVVDVGKPPKKIATPSAIKKPNATPEPTPTPTP